MGPAPKGYINKTVDTGNKLIVPSEPDATMIRNVFYRIAEGIVSVREIHRITVKSGFKCILITFGIFYETPYIVER